MTDYHYPLWRRGIFLALIAIVLVMVLLPPFTRGTVNIQVYTISTPDAVLHVLLQLGKLELHTSGVPSDIGWISITENLPTLELANQNGQGSPGALISSQVQSGRYDQIRISIRQATVSLVGNTLTKPVCSDCPPVSVNATIPVPPNGYGNLLLVLSPNYASLLSNPPALSLNVIQVVTP